MSGQRCPGAEMLLRAVIDNDEGVEGAVRRERWLEGQSPGYVQDLADSLHVLYQVACRVFEKQAKRARQ
jgi:hypothetical protein